MSALDERLHVTILRLGGRPCGNCGTGEMAEKSVLCVACLAAACGEMVDHLFRRGSASATLGEAVSVAKALRENMRLP